SLNDRLSTRRGLTVSLVEGGTAAGPGWGRYDRHSRAHSRFKVRTRCRARTSVVCSYSGARELIMNKPIPLTLDDDAAASHAITRNLRRQYDHRFSVLRAEPGTAALESLSELKLSGDEAALHLADIRIP